jgi:DNA gyrase subunit A
MAGIKLAAGAEVVFFSSLSPDEVATAVVATVAVGSQMLAGTDPGSAKVSDFSEYPAKGRATGGVRSQRFLKGEDAIGIAWAGAAPALAVSTEGSQRTLPETGSRRDASGTLLDAVIGAIGSQIA